MWKLATLAKRPIQVYLRTDQMSALRGLASRRDVPIAELIRQGVDRLLGNVPAEGDPLTSISGMVNSDLGYPTEQHDVYPATSAEMRRAPDQLPDSEGSLHEKVRAILSAAGMLAPPPDDPDPPLSEEEIEELERESDAWFAAHPEPIRLGEAIDEDRDGR